MTVNSFKNYSSELSKVRSGASSDKARNKWLMIKILAILSLPLLIYIVIAMMLGNGDSYDELKTWLSNPLNTAVIILAMCMLCWHATLGLMTVVHDYVHNKGLYLFLSLFIKSFFGLIAIVSVVSIFFIIFKN